MVLAKRFAGLLLILIWLLLVQFNSAMAQFNGEFEIERHYLAIENFLDWKAYQPPFSWEYEWVFAPTGIRASVGSVSMEEFYVFNEIRFTTELSPYATFYYNQLEDSFYRKDPIYQEVEFRIGKTYALSLIGFPFHDKKNAQMGYALSRGKRYSNSLIRLSRLDQYFFYNEKNIDTEKNTNDDEYRITPTFNRLEIQWFWQERLFIQMDLRKTTKTEFETNNPANVSTFEGSGYQVTIDWMGKNSWVLGLTGYGNDEFRSRKPESATIDNPDLEQDLVLQWLDLYYHKRLSEKNQITFGMLNSKFNNQINSSFVESEYDCLFTTFQIYGFWEKKRSEWFRWLFSLQAGNAVLKKDYVGIEETVDDNTMEMKAGIGIIMMEAGSYRLYCNTTWDLDIFDTRQWDGGNVQLQVVF